VVNKKDFVDKLDQEPFKTSMVCDLPTNLNSVINYSREIHDASGNFVDLGKFKELLVVHIDKLTMRSKELLNIKRVLDERGETIENVLLTIKSTNDKIEDLGIELIDFAQLCHMTEVKLDLKTQLEPIMETFDRNLYGEVAATDLISAFNTAHFGIFEEGDQEEGKVVNAKRYFLNPEDVIDQMCIEIDERSLTDFGSFLKGNDLFHEGKIMHHCFFQILSKVFEDLVGDGDILDVIKFFDSENTGTISIKDVQRTFNAKI
jgi:Ca2+-binding EF-hand superfamily protein